jgi:hypothetical protein
MSRDHRRRPRLLSSALVLVLCVAQVAADSLITAICSKTKEQLEAVVSAAAARGKPMEVPEGADHDTLAAALYASAKKEVDPAHAAPWPGCDGVPPPSPKPAPQAAKPTEQWKQMAKMVFKKHDANGDGELTREELQTMIEQTNAAAKAQGKVAFEGDFFDSVDANKVRRQAAHAAQTLAGLTLRSTLAWAGRCG